MDLRQLRYFSAIAEAGSLSKASERLHIAQPALSLHLSRLEDELGVSLMQRSSRGVKLTEHGELLFKHATRILRDVSHTVSTFKAGAAGLSGEVAVGFPTTTPDALVRLFLERSRDRFPGIFLKLIENTSERLEAGLHDASLDFAVILVRKPTLGFEIEHLLFEDYVLVSPAGSPDAGVPIDFGEVCQLPLLLPRPGVSLRDLIEDSARSIGALPTVVHELDTARFLKCGVQSGRGHTILPWSATRQESAEGQFTVRQIVNPNIRGLLGLAGSLVRPASHAREAVKTLLVDLIKSLVKEGGWSAEVFLEGQRRGEGGLPFEGETPTPAEVPQDAPAPPVT